VTKTIGMMFKPEMVRAILAGIKTETRRMPKALETVNAHEYDWEFLGENTKKPGVWGFSHDDQRVLEIKAPHGTRGDEIWVRETWCSENPEHPRTRICYRADLMSYGHAIDLNTGQRVVDFPEPILASQKLVWKPSLLMPRWASRAALPIIEARAERLLDITEAGARAEGALTHAAPLGGPTMYRFTSTGAVYPTARDAYLAYWDTINGAGSSAKNPWVTVTAWEPYKGAS
jgi:hypothetical protein